MNITSKRGALDNVVTYEHYCDEKKDLTNIPQDQITLGSIAIVLKDDGDLMCVYIANSNKEWIPIGIGGGGSDMSDISLANLLDISLANPADGQTLVYNEETNKWENKEPSNIGDDIIIIKVTEINNYDVSAIDKTYNEITEYAKNNKLMMLVYPEDWDYQPAYYIGLSTQRHVFMRTTIGFNMGGITVSHNYIIINSNEQITTYSKIET